MIKANKFDRQDILEDKEYVEKKGEKKEFREKYGA
jgi:hypothetical protein